MRNRRQSGFTLIEMLVVIAIIAILVAVIVPVVSNATARAKASTDAANLRSVLGQANVLLMENDANAAAAIAGMQPIQCATIPGAVAYIGYREPGFIAPFYVSGDRYYPLEYFADIADTGSTTVGTDQPSGYILYKVGN